MRVYLSGGWFVLILLASFAIGFLIGRVTKR